MARDGLKAVPPAKEPNELYDSLSQDGQDHWDEIGALGYTPLKGHGNMWWARRSGTADKGEDIGPSESISVLVTMVKEFVAEEARLLEENGSDRLPGMEEPATEELDRLADKVLDLRQKKDDAKAAFKDAEEEFQTRMNDLHRKRYTRKGMHMIIEERQAVTYKKAEGTQAQPAKQAA
jgi:hypothetical protein